MSLVISQVNLAEDEFTFLGHEGNVHTEGEHCDGCFLDDEKCPYCGIKLHNEVLDFDSESVEIAYYCTNCNFV